MMDDYDDGMNDYLPATGSAFLTLTLRNGVDLVIDATTEKLCEAVDLNGNKLTFTDRGITHSSGKGVVFERNYEGRISAITCPDGRRVEYIYNNKGDLIAVKDQTDARGNITTYTYNKYGQVTSITNNGITTYTNYDQDTGLPKTAVDANGNTTTYGFDSKGNMTSLTNSAGVQLLYSTYNKYGEVTSLRSTNGHTVYFEYDNNDDCIATYYVENGQSFLGQSNPPPYTRPFLV
jgi:YD repeat-containing protein